MTKTAVEQILEAVEERLCNIKSGSGYGCSVRKIKLMDGERYVDGDRPFIAYSQRDKDTTNDAYGDDIHELRLSVDIIDKADPKLPLKIKAARLEADVVTALNRSISAPLVSDEASLDLGDLVQSLTIRRVEYQSSEGQSPWAAALIDVTIIYHSDNSDPYTIKN